MGKAQGELEGRTIHIIGTNQLGNQALANFIRAETGAACACTAALQPATVEQLPGGALYLCDCLGKTVDDFMGGLLASICELTARGMVALFNVQHGLGVEDSCMGHGIRGVFYEDTAPELFLKGLLALHNNELWFTRDVMTRFIMDDHNGDVLAQKARSILTEREIEILSHVAVGCKNEVIADKLCVSPHTVKTHLYNIYKKINVTNRLQATLWAAKNL